MINDDLTVKNMTPYKVHIGYTHIHSEKAGEDF